MRILVTTPYERDSLQGNTVTAKRLVSIFSEAGLSAEIVAKGEKVSHADVLIALHARKSAHYIEDFVSLNPDGRVIVYLTGTDLYYDIPAGCELCERSMKEADTLVVSQESSLASVPEIYKHKAVVAQKSIQLPEGFGENCSIQDLQDSDIFLCVGHLRSVKQPFMSVEALQLIDAPISLRLLGGEVSPGLGDVAREWQDAEDRFQWLGRVSYEKTLQWIQKSKVTINTSLIEGGANSVGESIVLGVPVLASKIEGNVGMLGEEYAGYFSVEDKQRLADLMQRVRTDESFLQTLRDQVSARSKKFSRDNEMKDWMSILGK